MFNPCGACTLGANGLGAAVAGTCAGLMALGLGLEAAMLFSTGAQEALHGLTGLYRSGCKLADDVASHTHAVPDPVDRSARLTHLMAQGESMLTHRLRPHLQGHVWVVVRGYMAKAYRAVGGRYMDAHVEWARRAGMRVIEAKVSSVRTFKSNSRAFYEQLLVETGPTDKVVVMAHSHGTLSTLELLRNPEFAAVHDRVVGFIALNGVFGGTPIADLYDRRAPTGRQGYESIASLFGGEDGMMNEMSCASRASYMATHQQEIEAMVARVPTICLTTTYRWPTRVGDWVGAAMLPLRGFLEAHDLPNDGCVPEQSQRLPGAQYAHLGGMHHACSIDDFSGLDLQLLSAALSTLLVESPCWAPPAP